MILLIAEEIPLTIVWNVFVDVATVFVFIILDVALFPFTTDVNVFVAEVNELLVLDATRFVRSVLVATPFTEVVRVVPLVEIPFEDITEVVATTPFTVLVSTLPVTLCVNELMMFATDEVIPLIIVCRTFPVEVATEVLIILEEEVTPLTFDVIVFVAEEIVFELITELVAITPLIVVVKVLPDKD
jgi:hypothetical protein